MSPPIVGRARLAWWPGRALLADLLAELLRAQESMNFGPRNMQMSSEAMPPMRISPSIGSTAEAPVPGRPSATPSPAPGRPAGQLLEQRAGLLGRRDRRASRRRTPRA